MRPVGRSRGFTLVEVLLTLAIFSAVMVLLLSSFTGAERVREGLSSRSRDFRQIRIVLDRIGAELQGAFASNAVEDAAMTCVADKFSGKPASTLIFTAFTAADTGGGRPSAGVVKLKYFPRVGPDGLFVELHREESFLPLIENRIPTHQARMADRLLGFRVELHDGESWTDRWPPERRSGSALPERIAVILTDSRGIEYRRVVPLHLAGQEAQLPYSGRRRAEE
jgi:prepilin-type N-terminal cleavage/methylation domain-containing protein